jgi:hypothetical protein
MLGVLQGDLEGARKRSQVASQHFAIAMKEPSSGLPPSDASQRIRNASIEYSAFLTHVIFAISRLNAFVFHGTVPEDLKAPSE